MMVQRTTRGPALAGLLLLTAIAVLHGCGGRPGGAGGFSMPPMPVEVSPVQVRSVVDRFDAVGTVEAIEAITVVSEIDGSVKAIPFQEGGTIERGALIARLDDAQLSAEVARARALLAQSQATYDRVKTIVDQRAAAPQDLDDAAAALKVARANLDLAIARFDKTRIVAPFQGNIGARRISVGAFVRAGTPIAELANIDEIRVIFSAPERFLSRLSQGAPVGISTPAFPGHEVSGKIIVVEPIIDQATRSARIVARVQNVGRRFRPGMSANVSARLSERTSALTIPNESVFGSGDQSFVFVLRDDSTVTRVALRLGTRLPDVVEVLEGLEAGMTVVSAGHQKIFEGGKVLPIGVQADAAAVAPEKGG